MLTGDALHPYGYAYLGREAVENALDACTRPFFTLKKIIERYPDLSNAEILARYQGSVHIPTVGEHVISAVCEQLVGK